MSDLRDVKLYVVKSHVDKPIEGVIEEHPYETPIQAGAALTDQRICEVNDYDGFVGSISERNLRYGEATAIYWIGNHLDLEYVGIEHYRRRFDIGEDELRNYIEDDTDIITTIPCQLDYSIKEDYLRNHYGGDWVMLMELLRRHDAANADFYEAGAEKKEMHYGSLNIMKSELFWEYCDWAFPILDEIYHVSPEKTDAYNRRDLGFLSERLSHFFVCRMKKEGRKVVECNVRQYSPKVWQPADECDIRNFDEVYQALDRLYVEHQITKCCQVLGEAEKYGAYENTEMKELMDIFLLGIDERMQSQVTLHEYLPLEMRKDLPALISTYRQFKEIMTLYVKTPTSEMKELVENYISVTGFSTFAVDMMLENVSG